MNNAYQLSNLISRPFPIIVIIGSVVCLGILYHLPYQIPYSTQETHSLQFRIIHPEKSNARTTDQTLTRPLENLLIDLPGLKNMYSTTSNGAVQVTLVFHTTPDPGVIQSWLYKALRNSKSSFPPGLSLPVIDKPEEQNNIGLTGPFWSSQHLKEELILHLQRCGIMVNSDSNPAFSTRIDESFLRQFSSSNVVSKKTGFSDFIQHLQAPITLGNGIQRFINQTHELKFNTPSNASITNGKPVINLHVFGSRLRILESLKEWTAYDVFKKHIKLPMPLPLWSYSGWILILIVQFSVWVMKRSPLAEIGAQAIALIFALLLIHFTNTSMPGVQVLFVLLLLLPVLSLGSFVRPRSEPAINFFVLIGFAALSFWSRDSLPVWNDAFSRTSIKKINFQLHGLPTDASTSFVFGFLNQQLEEMKKPYTMESTSGIIRGQLETAPAAITVLRKQLIKKALNTSGAQWFIEAPGYADFSTHPVPIYPGNSWTLSSPSYDILLKEARRLVGVLNRYPGVLHARILRSIPFAQTQKSGWLLHDPLIARKLKVQGYIDSAFLHSRIFLGRRAYRGNQVFTPLTPGEEMIKKRDRMYFLEIGHEFRGSGEAQRKLEQFLLNQVSDNVFLNPFEGSSIGIGSSAVEFITVLCLIAAIPMCLLINNPWLVIQTVLSGVAFPFCILSIHYATESAIPMDWEIYFFMLFLTGLFLAFRYVSLKQLVLVSLLLLCCSLNESLNINWILILASTMLIREFILRVQKWISEELSPPRPWRDRQFSQMN